MERDFIHLIAKALAQYISDQSQSLKTGAGDAIRAVWAERIVAHHAPVEVPPLSGDACRTKLTPPIPDVVTWANSKASTSMGSMLRFRSRTGARALPRQQVLLYPILLDDRIHDR